MKKTFKGSVDYLQQKQGLLIIGGIVIVLGVLYFVNGFSPMSTSPVVATVGSVSITEKDIAYKVAVEHAYGNTSFSNNDALTVLINNAQEEEVAKQNGVLPTDSDIASFKDHVNTTTKAPELLTTVKGIFGSDESSYEKIFLLPEMINVNLHSFFSTNGNVNAEASSTLWKARNEVAGGKAISDVVKEYALQDTKTTVTVSTNTVYSSASSTVHFVTTPPAKGDTSRNTSSSVTAKVGDVSPVTQSGNSLSFTKLLSIQGSKYTYEVFSLPAVGYDTWFANMIASIPVDNKGVTQ